MRHDPEPKIFNKTVRMNVDGFFKAVSPSTTRALTFGHPQRVLCQRATHRTRVNCFSQRMIEKWNALPIVEAKTVDQVKSRLDKYWIHKRYETSAGPTPTIRLNTTMRYIVPKSKALGIDICGVNKYSYIIRSDLGCYMRSSNFESGKDLVVRTIHPKCLGGYFYLAHEDEYFYIVNSDTYRRVTNLNKGTDCVVYTLHPNCRGGDHYLSAHGSFFIIYEERGVYRRTLNMQKDYQGAEFPLHPLCMDGLFYWGTKDYVYYIKYKNKADLRYHRTCSLNQNTKPSLYPFSTDVINFLPGGIAITKGFTSGKWQYVKSVINDSEQPITWIKKINRNIDDNRRKMTAIEDNWHVKTKQEPGGLTTAILRYQLSLPPKFGGSNIIIDEGKWMNDTSNEDESVSLVMEPGQRIYCWQYKLSIGDEDVLFWRDMKIEYDSKPPVDPPPYAEIINQDLHEGFACSKIKLYYGAFEDRDRELSMAPRSSLG